MQGTLKSNELKAGMNVKVHIKKVGIVEGRIAEINRAGLLLVTHGWIYWSQCPMIVRA